MKSFKIKVYNETISNAAQEKLFELGYRWMIKDAIIMKTMKTSSLYLFAWHDGAICAGGTIDTFNNLNFKELTINELMEMEPEQSKKIEKLKLESHELESVTKLGREGYHKINEIIDVVNKLNLKEE